MADQNLLDFFSGPAITKLANAMLEKRGLPVYYPKGFGMVSSARPTGVNFGWDAYVGVRASGRFTAPGSPPVKVEVPGVSKMFATALGGREEFDVPSELETALTSNLPTVAVNARDEYLRRIANFNTRATSRRTNMIASVAMTGALYTTPVVAAVNQGRAVGNVITTASGSGAVNTLAGYTPTILDQGDTLPASAVTVPDWSSASTDIPAFMREVRRAFIAYTGYEPRLAQYGQNIPSYMGSVNTSMQAYWSRNQNLGGQFQSTNEVPSNVLDFTWHPSYLQYFLDESTATPTATQWMPGDQLVITPDITDDWYEFVEGSNRVPKGIPGLVGNFSLEQGMNEFDWQWGISGYSKRNPDTFQLSTVLQDFTLPTPKNGKVQWIITVA